MAELQASYIQASSHPADTDRLVLEGLMNPAGAPVSGAAYGVGRAANDLKVQAVGSPNMTVDVLSGHAWIDGTEGANQGAYHVYNDATKNLVISAAHATLARKDLVVAKVQDAAYSGAVNAWSLAVVTGTPAGSPAEPAVPANAIVLALVDVAAAAASITNANITDRRRRASALGGIVVCTSGTRPTTGLYEGLHIYETDTDKELVYDGAGWVEMGTAGAWTSYTPTLTQGGAVTKTVTYARYTRVGRWIVAQGILSVTGAGSGGSAVLVGLPVAAAGTAGQSLGQGKVTDVSAGPSYRGVCELVTSTTFGFVPTASTANNYLGSTDFTAALANGDAIVFNVSYEAAS